MITAPATMVRLTILRTNWWSEADGRLMSAFTEVAALSSFEGVAAWCISILVEQNPGRECENDHQARINERARTEEGFQIAGLNDPMGDERQGKSANDADHPGRKIRA